MLEVQPGEENKNGKKRPRVGYVTEKKRVNLQERDRLETLMELTDWRAKWRGQPGPWGDYRRGKEGGILEVESGSFLVAWGTSTNILTRGKVRVGKPPEGDEEKICEREYAVAKAPEFLLFLQGDSRCMRTPRGKGLLRVRDSTSTGKDHRAEQRLSKVKSHEN